MADIGTLIDFTDGNVLYAAQLDSNFGDIRTVVNSAVVHTDKSSQVITKTITFTPDAGVGFTVSTGGATITAGGLTVTAGGVTVAAGGVTVTGNSTITGTLTSLTGITSSGTAAFANVTASGTLGVTGACTLGVVGAGAITCTDLTVSGGSTVSITGASSAALTMSGGNVTLYSPSGLTRIGASSLATTATVGFPVIPTCVGAPSGAATTGSLVYDTGNDRFYVRKVGAWAYATLT